MIRQSQVAPPRVRIRAPARLHLGFLDMEGGLGRRFGSLGVTLEELWTELLVSPAQAFAVTGAAEAERARAMLERLAAAWDLPPLHVAIQRTIPTHAGLGSGTQLALALGVAAARAAGIDRSAREVALLLERGARSGIGIGAFEQGGFLVDGGRGADGLPPPLIARLRPSPEYSYFVACLHPLFPEPGTTMSTVTRPFSFVTVTFFSIAAPPPGGVTRTVKSPSFGK